MSAPTIRRFLWYLCTVPRCAACHKLLTPDSALSGMTGSDVLCRICRAEWEQEKLDPCPVCGEAGIDCRCMPETLADTGVQPLLRLGSYHADGAIGRVILRMKETRLRRAARFAAAQLVPAVRRTADASGVAPAELVVTFLPRSRSARRRAGHDQAELVARALAGYLGARFAPLLRRTGESRAQKSLSGDARLANVRDAFSTPPDTDLTGLTVLLFDDIVTSGAGMAAGVRVLRDAGAANVICAALAVTPQKDTENAKK